MENTLDLAQEDVGLKYGSASDWLASYSSSLNWFYPL